MSIFGNNNTSLGRYDSNEIAADESYVGFTGLANILIENAYNEQALFEAVIADDFREICLSESSDIIALNESRISDFFKTIKKLIDKFIAKIKGFFKNIIDKFRKKGKEDNDTIVKEYEEKRKNVNTSKDSSRDNSSKNNSYYLDTPKDNSSKNNSASRDNTPKDNSSKDIEKLIVKYRPVTNRFHDFTERLMNHPQIGYVIDLLYAKKEEDFDEDLSMIKKISSGDWENKTEKIMDGCFKKEEEREFKDIENMVLYTIKRYDKRISQINKQQNAIISELNELKQVIDKFEKGASIDDLDDDQKRQYDITIKTSNNNTEFLSKKIKAANEVIQNYLNSVPKEAALIIKLYTFEYNQAKAVLKVANAAMGSSSVNNESACIIDAIMESSMYEDSLYFE